MMADVKQAHKHQMFRATLPAIMVIVVVHFCCTQMMGPPNTEKGPEMILRSAMAAAQLGGISANLYVWTIDDDDRAHLMLVRLNEINTVLASVGFVVYTNWLAATGDLSSFTISQWSVAQVGGLFGLAAFIVNLMVFPEASRRRLLAYVSIAAVLEPTFTPLPQPTQALFFSGAWMAGELCGRQFYGALLKVYMRQEVDKAQLLQQALRAIEHSRHIESERREQLIAMKSREGKRLKQWATQGSPPRPSPAGPLPLGGLTTIADDSRQNDY